MKKIIFLLNTLLFFIYCSAQVSDPIVMVLTQPTCTEPTGTIQVTYPVANQPMNLFISEVTDQLAGALTYIEIYNGTGTDISLNNYKIRVFNNGNSSPSCDLILSGAILNNTIKVIALGSTTNLGGIIPNLTFASCGGINNNDCIKLTDLNNNVIDLWGATNGSVFTITNAGYDYRRNSNSLHPNTVWNASDWVALPNEDYSNIGLYNEINYQYSLDNGPFQSGASFSGMLPGVHAIKAMEMASGLVSNPTTFIVNATTNPYINGNSSICTGQSTTLTVVGYCPNSNILWSNGSTSDSITVNPTQTTNYSVTISFPYTLPNDLTLSQTVVVNNNPYFVGDYAMPLHSCDQNNDGFETFDLTQTINSITGGNPDYLVTFYETQIDAEIGGISIPNSANYVNVNPFIHNVYIRITSNTSNCYQIVQLQLIVDATPEIITPADYVLCDYTGSVGYESFDLTTVIPQVIGSVNPASYYVTFFTTLAEAQSETNPISNVTGYVNITINTQTIYVRLTTIATGCYSIATLQLIVNPLTSGQCNYVTDADGNLYNTVVIGNQEWMAENLRTTKYCNGDVLPVNNNWPNEQWGNLTVGAWNFVGGSQNNYGKLYNWFAAVDSRNICPCNWHVPTDNEWTELENYLIANGFNYDGSTIGNKIAKSMASNSLQNLNWTSSTNIGAVGNNLLLNNSSGFNAKPEGSSWGSYGYSAELYTFWWTTNEWTTDNTYATWRGLSYQNSNLSNGAPDIGLKTAGLSIRCLKNAPLNTENLLKASFYIYPNPTENSINIVLPIQDAPSEYIICDLSGKKILQGTVVSENTTINVKELQNGIYFIKISNSTKSKTQKFIKF
jgi:uncharacterized protein (TIGR02145 family)